MPADSFSLGYRENLNEIYTLSSKLTGIIPIRKAKLRKWNCDSVLNSTEHLEMVWLGNI